MAGFYRSTENFARDQPRDLVKCFYCMLEKGYWCKRDDPVEIHNRLSPDCKWMKYDIRSDSGCEATIAECVLIREKQSMLYNRLVDDGSWDREFPYPRNFIKHIRNSVAWLYDSVNLNVDHRAQFPPLILSERPIYCDDTTRLLDWILFNSKIVAGELETMIRRKIWWYVNKTYVEANGYIAAADKAMCVKTGRKDLCIVTNRLATFNDNATPFLTKNAEAFAMAGFYRLPKGTEDIEDGDAIDSCYCFFCGLCGENWTEDDDPYHEHVKWSNGCGYIRTKLNKPQMKSILYHFYKDALAKTFDLNFKRSVLENILDLKSCSQDDMAVKSLIFRSLERRPELLALIGKFTITEIVNELFYKISADGLNRDGMLSMVLNITREDLEARLTARCVRKPTLCECQESIGIDDKPGISGTEVKDFEIDEVEPPSIEELLSLPMPKPEPPKTLPYAQLPSTNRANMFANEEYKKYTREQAIDKLENLLQSYTCAVCMSAPSCIAFIPCGHMVTCTNCNMGNPYATCPLCRAKIESQVPIRLCETQTSGCYA
ncbi:inhibitor of apoptosis protein-like [Ostrea edulis]|uniref:inhibitor of apoptosis protein-like n=1 Tax=Ostrea edulis TaxID=37623 RepID=UPI0024AF17AB|nr:inhibitor of apoptosis protein-like [Ostrea edulis]